MNKLILFASGVLTGYGISHIYELKSIVTTVLHRVYTPSSTKKVTKNTYELTYHHQGREYKMRLPIKRGPKKVVRIMNEHEHDVTDHVMSYLGPNEDLHNLDVMSSPLDFDHQQLHFHTRSGDILTFSQEDKIKIE